MVRLTARSRPYDLRHAALSLWLNASGEPTGVVARAGNSARVLPDVYLHCVGGQDDLISKQIEDALATDSGIHASHLTSGFAISARPPGP
ncbi:MAG: hypothetical protein ACRDOH_33400 [Streptosporangiaceae bacterium]